MNTYQHILVYAVVCNLSCVYNVHAYVYIYISCIYKYKYIYTCIPRRYTLFPAPFCPGTSCSFCWCHRGHRGHRHLSSGVLRPLGDGNGITMGWSMESASALFHSFPSKIARCYGRRRLQKGLVELGHHPPLQGSELATENGLRPQERSEAASVFLSITCLSIVLFYLSINLSVYLYIFLLSILFIYLSIYLSIVFFPWFSMNLYARSLCKIFIKYHKIAMWWMWWWKTMINQWI